MAIDDDRLAVASASRPPMTTLGTPCTAGATSSASVRVANIVAIPSSGSLRAMNPSTTVDSVSSHYASSMTQNSRATVDDLADGIGGLPGLLGRLGKLAGRQLWPRARAASASLPVSLPRSSSDLMDSHSARSTAVPCSSNRLSGDQRCPTRQS
jgi:hypothetical protein